MKKSFFILIFLLFSLLSVTGQEERVYTFHSDIDIETNGKINVREEIKVYAAGRTFKRGITRALPVYRTDAGGKRIRVSYKIEKVLQNGRKAKFFTEREGGDLVIYVGDKNVLLNHDYYTYEIFYSSPGQLGFFEDFDELYWNVNGASDNVTDKVSTRITMPGDAEIINHQCYTGKYGSTSNNCVSVNENAQTFYAETVNLEADGLLTVAVSFTPGVVQQRGTASYRPTMFDRFGLVFITVGLSLFLALYYSVTWRKYGVDPPKPVVIPLFSPPEGISPASAGMLQKELYSDDLITSAIVNLAVKGYIRIKEREVKGMLGLKKNKHFTLIKLKDSDNALANEEKRVMSGLFATKDEVEITGKYSSSIENMMNSFRTSLKKQNNPILNEGRNLKLHAIPLLLMSVYLFFLFSFLVFIPDVQSRFYFKGIIFMFLPAMFLVFLINRFVKKLRRWFLSLLVGLLVTGGSVAVFYKFPLHELSANSKAFLIGFPILVIAYLIYGYLIVRPGEKKLNYQAKIQGLKMYMDVAEEKQMQYFNPPDITPEIFEQLLPYAIALNMDKIWGEKFQQKFLSSLTGQNVYQPGWYTGTVMRPAIMGNTLRNSLNSSIRTASANPRSGSGGSWGSGSSGGGFSGGGGGGGRVGGW